MNAEMTEDWFSPEATTFGDRLSGAREEAGMDQEEMARRLGIKINTLRNWENDLAEPRANKLSMMAGMLNVSLSWLMTGEGEGLQAEARGALPDDAAALLDEMHAVQAQMAQGAERLAQLERELRGLLRADADA
jgi:transcriptional regulator with XRE-family HTH domain